MALLLLIAAVVGWWAWRRGVPKTLGHGDIVAGAAFVIGIALLLHGRPGAAVLALAGAGGWAWHRRRTPAGGAMTRTEALAVLELAPDADAGDIRAAHRRIVARVHPDHGGSNALTRRVNLARDTLLAARD